MNKVFFEIKGEPLVKGRPRFKKIGNRVATYTPKRTAMFENLVKMTASKHFEKPFEGPIAIELVFLMPRPQRLVWKTKPMPECPCDKRPDADNLTKAITDGLNGIAFKDDAQIAEQHVYKRYHSGDEGPKTIVTIWEL